MRDEEMVLETANHFMKNTENMSVKEVTELSYLEQDNRSSSSSSPSSLRKMSTKNMEFESFFSAPPPPKNAIDPLKRAHSIGILILNTLSMLTPTRFSLLEMGLLHSLSSLLHTQPTNVLLSLTLTNMTFLPPSTRFEILKSSPEILSFLSGALITLVSISSLTPTTPHPTLQSLTLNPIPTPQHYEGLLHIPSIKWVIASIRNLLRFESADTLPQSIRRDVALQLRKFNVLECLSRLVYPSETIDVPWFWDRSPSVPSPSHPNTSGRSSRSRGGRSEITAVRFACDNWGEGEIADYALDALLGACMWKECRTDMRNKKVHISFLNIHAACYRAFESGRVSNPPLSHKSSSSSSSLPSTTSSRYHKSPLYDRTAVRYEYSVMILATKVKMISTLLSRTKANYFTGTHITYVEEGTPTVEETFPPQRPSNELISRLNLILTPRVACTLTWMLNSLVDDLLRPRYSNLVSSPTVGSTASTPPSSPSGGDEASPPSSSPSSTTNNTLPTFFTTPHDVTIEIVLTTIVSLIHRNLSTFAQHSGQSLVLSLVTILASHAGMVKPQVSSGVKTLGINMSIIARLVKDTSMTTYARESNPDLVRDSDELLAILRSLSEKYTKAAKLDPSHYGRVSETPTIVHKILEGAVSRFGAFPADSEVIDNDEPLVEVGSFIGSEEDISKRELIKLGDIDDLSQTKVMCKVIGFGSDSQLLDIPETGEVTVFSSLLTAAKAFSGGAYYRHTERVDLFKVLSTIDLACKREGLVRYDRIFKFITSEDYAFLLRSEDKWLKETMDVEYKSLTYHGGWCEEERKGKKRVIVCQGDVSFIDECTNFAKGCGTM
ncbi:hypothetical protein TrCOL_g4322 [Triparma columacea]|uniref:Uncharacterized protein n=1 Tax=Triparma columacea TaxID=722753 RepID=A0A9W7LG34_9STRA|nr:hypothetical protein TrCOL_g4322 [Triparma columacea]